MDLSESGRSIVDTFTRQISALVRKLEQSESEKQELIAGHAGETALLRRRIETVEAELIDKRARLDETQGQLTLANAELGMTQRDLNAQTAALEHLRRSAAAFGGAVQDVLGKNLEADAAARNIEGTDEIERLLAIEHAKPDMAQPEAPRN